MSPPLPLDRSAIRHAYRMEEAQCADRRVQEAGWVSQAHDVIQPLAVQLVEEAEAGAPLGAEDAARVQALIAELSGP